MEETFQAYTKEADTDQIKALFEHKYGYQPTKVLDSGTVWLAGPIGVVTNHRGALTGRVTTQKGTETNERTN